MAIKILKRGIHPADVIYRAKCFYCKTEIEFARSDAKYISSYWSESYLEIECPVCKSSVTLDIR